MNVLHVTPAYFPATYWGGPIFSVLGLNEALVRHGGIDLRVLTTDSAGPRLAQKVSVGGSGPVRAPGGYRVYYSRRIAGADCSLELLGAIVPLARWADVVHLTATYSFPTLPTLLACRMLRKPLVWSPRGALQATHEWDGAKRKALKRLWERTCALLLSRKRSILHVTSAGEKAASLARIPLPEARIIRNGVEVPSSLPARRWTPDATLRLLFLGRLDPKKGIDNLLRGLAQLKDARVTLEICGTGEPAYAASLARLAAELQLAERVSFRGHVDGHDKTAAFARADLCVAPSHSENFCIVVAEALAHGVPAIASTGTPWRGLTDRQCGLWIDNSPASLAAGIERMRHLPLEEMGRRGRAWMQQEFGWDAVAKEMYELYRSLSDASRH